MSIRYSQDLKDSLVKSPRRLFTKSLAESSKDSIGLFGLKQATPIMIKGQSKTLKKKKRRQVTREGLAIWRKKTKFYHA